jgi:hypothetical protein
MRPPRVRPRRISDGLRRIRQGFEASPSVLRSPGEIARRRYGSLVEAYRQVGVQHLVFGPDRGDPARGGLAPWIADTETVAARLPGRD